MAAFWTSVFVMVIPIGLAVLIAWPDAKIIAFGIMAVGAVLGAIGLSLTIRDERAARTKERNEEERRKQNDLRDQLEHEELLAFITGTGNKMSTPRTLRLIKRIREIRSEDEHGNE